ncbi:MAG: ABC transporter permease, partial [Psittacicella sp.]
RIGDFHGVSYMSFIIPGLIMMAIITNSYSNVASSFYGSKFTGNIQSLISSPASTPTILLGYVSGGVARGVLIAIIISIAANFFTPIDVHSWFAMIFTVILTSAIFSLAGLINAVYANSFDDISIIPTFVLTPLTYLGGVFYAINMLPHTWRIVSRFDIIVYMVGGFRYSLLGFSSVNILVTYAVLIVAFLLLFSFAMYALGRGSKLKS